MGDKLRFKDYDDAANYEPTDSEDNLSEEEKELLKKVRQGNKRKQSSKQEVLAFDESDENEDDDGDDNDEDAGDDDNDEEDDVRNLIADSDIEGATDDDDDDLPDTKAWGKKSQNYYGSDFVDQNYSSAYTDKELELAEMEEEEALATQQRLAENIKDEDFFELYENNSDAGEDTTINKEIPQVFNINKLKTKTNPTILSKREKLELFENDAPEFMGLVEDLQMGLNECGKLLFPIMEYARDHKLPKIPALQFAELMNTLLTTYCSNINFYLILKANRVSIPTHPISKRLLDLKEILESLTPRYEKIIKPQLEALLERIEDGDEFEILPMKKTAEKAKSSKKAKSAKKAKKAKAASKGVTEQSSEDEMAAENEDDQGEEAAEQGDEDDERRGITYQISKNKGLTPHRKKELRNPRVKHRSKFRKALIRRKGAVRTVRTETKRYGGEISGIKATVSKSVKFKS